MTDGPTETPANYAGFWLRVAAAVIDYGIITMPLYLVSLLMVGFEPVDRMPVIDDWADVGRVFVRSPADFFLSWVTPAVITVACWQLAQATPGKLLLGAIIVDARTGQKPSFGQFLLRYLGYILTGFTCCLGALWIAFDRRNQGLHDKIARTLVIRRPPR